MNDTDGIDPELAECAATAGAERALDSFREALTVETKSGPMDAVTAVDRAVQRVVVETLRADSSAPVVAEEDVARVDTRESVPAAGPAWIVDPIDGTRNYVAGNRNWAVAVAGVPDCGRLGRGADSGDATPGDAATNAAGDGTDRAPVGSRPTPGVVSVTACPALGERYVGKPGATGDSGESDGPGVLRGGTPATTSERSDPGAFAVNPIFGTRPRDRRSLPAVAEAVMDDLGDLRRIGCAQLALAGVACGELEACVSTRELNDWDAVGGVELIRRAGGTVTTLSGARWSPGDGSLLASNATAHDELRATFEGVSGAL